MVLKDAIEIIKARIVKNWRRLGEVNAPDDRARYSARIDEDEYILQSIVGPEEMLKIRNELRS